MKISGINETVLKINSALEMVRDYIIILYEKVSCPYISYFLKRGDSFKYLTTIHTEKPLKKQKMKVLM
ncbi:MAG: hypothetical protein JHC31_15255, partial [Sulfurihydrogenibium sp.]|nr:hypothetical protein [Sulfurihydrogenibium sp.]